MPSSGASRNSAFQPNSKVQTYLRSIRSPWKLRLYFFKKLPSALWWGIRVKSVTPEQAEVTIPYSWRTKNPFRSTYFAAMVGAGELSTGILANLARLNHGNISMLVLEQKAEFVKKATTTITFTCKDGEKALAAVQQCIEQKAPQTVTMISTGRNAGEEVVARIYITWTFKVRSSDSMRWR